MAVSEAVNDLVELIDGTPSYRPVALEVVVSRSFSPAAHPATFWRAEEKKEGDVR